MFDVGWTELLVIGVVALIVIGPKDLPEMFRTLGRFTAKARSMAREFQRAMEAAADDAGVKDVANDLKTITSPRSLGLEAVKDAATKFEKWDPLKGAGKPAPVKPVAPPPAAIGPKGPATQALAEAQAAKRAALGGAAATVPAPGTPEPVAPAPATPEPGSAATVAAVPVAQDLTKSEAAPQAAAAAPARKPMASAGATRVAPGAVPAPPQDPVAPDAAKPGRKPRARKSEA
jgi:sec-independent protein translocase protein TatB